MPIAPTWAAEPSAQELVAKNLEARGGAEALRALRTIQFKGTVRFPGDFELDYVETRARSGQGGAGAVRYDSTLQGLTLIQAYDGKTGWAINPFGGRRDAETMSADDARSLADAGLVDGPLLSAATNGSTVEYLGREDFDGTLVYKLRVSEKDGDSFVYLLDPGTYLEVGVTETRKVRGAEQVFEYELGDYEKVGGVYFPMSVASGQKGSSERQQVSIEMASANAEVKPGYFAQPASPAAKPTASK
ncbi:MAG: hypothetical protein AABY88_04320 [Pseudomonadota bacterium]